MKNALIEESSSKTTSTIASLYLAVLTKMVRVNYKRRSAILFVNVINRIGCCQFMYYTVIVIWNLYSSYRMVPYHLFFIEVFRTYETFLATHSSCNNFLNSPPMNTVITFP